MWAGTRLAGMVAAYFDISGLMKRLGIREKKRWEGVAFGIMLPSTQDFAYLSSAHLEHFFAHL